MGLHNKNNNRGFTFIEVLLVFAVLMASIAGVYLMLKPASLKAGIEKEQKNLASVVSEVQGAFGRTQGTYEGLTVEKIQALRPEGLKFDLQPNADGFQEAMIVSKFNDSMTVRPAEVKKPNDAFDVVYRNLNEKKCYGFIKTFYPQSYGIYVGESEQAVQETVGLSEGRIASDDVLFAACGTSDFKTNQGTLVFRFYEPMAFSAVATDLACGCTPETQTQDLPCGAGQSGVISQERTSDCSGGTPSCPQPNWSGWTTTGNTCTGAPVPMTPQTPVAPPAAQCVPGQLFQNLSCAAGETGQITQRRDVTCPVPTGAPVMGAWITIQNTCATPSSVNATCSTGVQSRFTACPVGQIGNVTERRTAECSGPFAVPVYGAWTEASRSCRVACADANNCCQPLPDQNRALSCPAGFWGTGTEMRNSWCVAASPTTPLAWSAWYITAGGCNACPAPSTATETRWTPQGGALCPAGQYGTNTWEREEQRSQTTTYNCPAGTPALPSPSISAWTGWTPTGATRNNVNTCVACPSNTTTPETRWVSDAAACPVGQVGSHTWERQETRNQNTTYSCPAGTATAPMPTTSWTPWTPTGTIRNEVNTCAVPVCSGANSQTQWVSVSAACPAGFTGSRDWEKEQSQSRTCTSPPTWDAWGAWTDTGNTRNFTDGCVAVGSCSTTTNFQSHDLDANDPQLNPAGISTDCGDLATWESTCSAGDICHVEDKPGAFGFGWKTYYEYDAVCTGTCSSPPPTDCNVPAGTTFNWTVSGNACTYTTSGPNVIGNGTSYTANDVTAPNTGSAGFLCTNGTLSMTANPGATCTAGCSPPATTNTTVYRAAPVESRTIACAAGFTGSITQERTRDEVGNEQTSWSCPGPNPSTTTTWSGTYTNHGAWVTTSDTCVATPPSGPDCFRISIRESFRTSFTTDRNTTKMRLKVTNKPEDIWSCDCRSGTIDSGWISAPTLSANFTVQTKTCTGTPDGLDDDSSYNYVTYGSSPLASPVNRSWSSSTATCNGTVPAGTTLLPGGFVVLVDNTPPGIGQGLFPVNLTFYQVPTYNSHSYISDLPYFVPSQAPNKLNYQSEPLQTLAGYSPVVFNTGTFNGVDSWCTP